MAKITVRLSEKIEDEFLKECGENDLKQSELFERVWLFHKKYDGMEKNIENKSAWIDAEQKKIKEEAALKTGILIEELEKREKKIKEKEAMWLAVKKLLD
jgi:hypothetical protein